MGVGTAGAAGKGVKRKSSSEYIVDASPSVLSTEEATNSVDTLRGLAEGVVEPLKVSLQPCVVFGEYFPSWLPSLRQMGFTPVLVVLHSRQFLNVVESTVPDGCAVWVGEQWDVFAAKPVVFSRGNVVAFVDAAVTVSLLNLFVTMKVPLAYCVDSPRRLPRGWRRRFCPVQHHLVGGASTSTTTVSALYHTSLRADDIHTPSSHEAVPMDMSTLLYDRTPMRPTLSRAAEVEDNLPLFEVRNVGGTASPHAVYHGGGWLEIRRPLSFSVLNAGQCAPCSVRNSSRLMTGLPDLSAWWLLLSTTQISLRFTP